MPLQDTVIEKKKEIELNNEDIDFNLIFEDRKKISELSNKLKITGIYQSSDSVEFYIHIYNYKGRKCNVYALCDGYFFTIMTIYINKDSFVYTRDGGSIPKTVAVERIGVLISSTEIQDKTKWIEFKKISDLPDIPVAMHMNSEFKKIIGKGGISWKEMEQNNLKGGDNIWFSIMCVVTTLSFFAILFGAAAQLTWPIQVCIVMTFLISLYLLGKSFSTEGFIYYELSDIGN